MKIPQTASNNWPRVYNEERKTVSWIHISDLHCIYEHKTFQQHKVLADLPQDIRQLSEKYNIEVDAIFFTGDAADARVAPEFFNHKFDPAIELLKNIKSEMDIEHVCVVPGNHDIARNKIPTEHCLTQSVLQQDLQKLKSDLKKRKKPNTKAETQKQITAKIKSIESIKKWIDNGASLKSWKAYESAFEGYRGFLEQLEDVFPCLRSQHPRELHGRHMSRYEFTSKSGLPVEIAGLNTVWNCWHKSTYQKGQLHVGIDWQLKLISDSLGPNTKDKVRIALMHHPGYWSWITDASKIDHYMPIVFDFCLHGHEHMSGQYIDPARTFTRIAAGACYTETGIEAFRYNLVEYDYTNRTVHVWMREFPRTGPEWRPYGVFENERMSYYLELNKDVYPTRPSDGSSVDKDFSGTWEVKLSFFDNEREWDECTISLSRTGPDQYVGTGYGRMSISDEEEANEENREYFFSLPDVKYIPGSGCIHGIWQSDSNDHHGVFQLDVDKNRTEMRGRFITSEDRKNNPDEILDHGIWTWKKSKADI